jgi:cullin-4
MLHVERQLEEEGDRVQQYLDQQTRKPLVAKLDAQLLEAHVQTIIEKGFEPLMMEADKRTDDLRRMYVLLGRVGALGSIKDALCGYVKKAGVEMVSNEERDKDLVSDLLAFKVRFPTAFSVCG